MRAALTALAAVWFGAAAEAREGCDPAAWSETDQAYWRAARAGVEEVSPYNDAGPFVSRLLGCAALADALPAKGLVMRGAKLGLLSVEHEAIAARFVCKDCRFGAIEAAGSAWARDFDITGSTIESGANFVGAEVKGAFIARAVRAKRPQEGPSIDLSGARVARSASLDDARIAGLVGLQDAVIAGDILARRMQTFGFDAGGASVGGDLDLSQALVVASPSLVGARVGGAARMFDFATTGTVRGAEFAVGGTLRLDRVAAAAIRMREAQIGENLSLNGALVDGAVALDKARIGGDLWIRAVDGQPAPQIGIWLAPHENALSLGNASVGGRVDIEGADIGAGLNLDAVRVAEDLWLRGMSRVGGKIDAVFARFGQNVDLSSAELGCVDATGAQIGGELRLGRPGEGRRSMPPRWRAEARMVLRNAAAAAWVDADGGVCDAPASWPDTVDLTGFEFARVGGLGGGAETSRERCGTHLGLLARQEPFSLDPYRRLADYLDAGGAAAAAREVRWAAKERQLVHAWEHGETLDAAALLAQRLFVGYGIYEHQVLGWIVGMILLGSVVFPRAPEARTSPIPLGFLYSFDMLLPFVSFRDAHDKIDFDSPFRFYLYFHKFMGWVFALFFASALGGLFAV